MSKTLLDILSDKILVGDDCWEWIGGTNDKGYGQLHFQGKCLKAHRVVYDLLIGFTDPELQLDHLCLWPPCVRPDHLEEVTGRENTRRGDAGKFWREKTHCPRGHPYSGDNLIIYRDGFRRCKTCRSE